ncbi:hypothetical protein PYCCODRAFT_1372383 [Trametes coccinea BRFM310]|uniref:DUF4218 domain-containing protein n=1 Tax=Trametes coccinea (strain BRFM310) TaxID=1353009 RepID=A0A1Y2IFD6_TRAC3|nr:hypothetical protein PYCCODRAFT_1372383 [Trametes coccinea BRFM310]
MHNLFLGELRHHCISVWGLKTAEKRGKDGNKRQVHTPEMQQVALDRIVMGMRNGSETMISSVRKDYLDAVLQYNAALVAISTSETKAIIGKRLVAWAAAAPNLVDAFRLPPVLPYATDHFELQSRGPPPPEPFGHTIFSHEILEAIRNDIKAIRLPSWLPTPPGNFGDASHGKLKADLWRTTCTVNMVITLVRSWGSPSATIKEKMALENFLHLVAAVDLATRYSMSAEQADRFDYHILEYLRGLRSLYNVDLMPNHHISLHLRECLLLFGPTFAWWAFPFERYNGLLQRMNTNHRPADMPKTFMRYFYIGAKLRWLISGESWPENDEDFQQVLGAFKEVFQEAAEQPSGRTNRAWSSPWDDHEDDVASPGRSVGTDQELDPALYDILLGFVNLCVDPAKPYYTSFYGSPEDSDRPFLPPTASFVPYVTRAGATFATHEHGLRNSFVLFRRASSGADVLAGQVSRIFEHTRVEGERTIKQTYLIIKEYKPLLPAHQAADPFRRFPDINAWLCYNQTFTTESIVRLEDVICHFASYVYRPEGIGHECIVVRSLDRVSPVPYICCTN